MGSQRIILKLESTRRLFVIDPQRTCDSRRERRIGPSRRGHIREILLWLQNSLMFPDGYAANLRRGASPEKHKIFGLKSHDWHIWLERVMSGMLRDYIPEEEWL